MEIILKLHLYHHLVQQHPCGVHSRYALSVVIYALDVVVLEIHLQD